MIEPLKNKKLWTQSVVHEYHKDVVDDLPFNMTVFKKESVSNAVEWLRRDIQLMINELKEKPEELRWDKYGLIHMLFVIRDNTIDLAFEDVSVPEKPVQNKKKEDK